MCKEKSTTSVDRFKFVSDTQLHKEMWANIASLSEVGIWEKVMMQINCRKEAEKDAIQLRM